MAEKGFLVGIWLKVDGHVRRIAKEPELAKAVAMYAVGSPDVEAWGFFDASKEAVEPEPAVSLQFQGGDHKRSQRVKPSEL